MSIAELEVAYPAHLEADVVLRNGRTLRIRPVRADDRERMRAFFSTLSPETLHARFFAVCTADQALSYAPSQVDYVHEFGVVGEVGDRIVAVAHYYSSAQHPRIAEVAFAIGDDQQGLGIGTLLMEKLAVAARINHIERFEAEVLDENARMLDVFLQSGYVVTRNTDRGTTHVSFAIEPTATSVARTASRAQNAAHQSMKAIFEPRSIAVVGAGRKAGQLGHEIVANLQRSGFTGDLYVVNPKTNDIDGVRSYPSLRDIEGVVDLAIIVVPAAEVEHVIDDCVEKSVRGAVVITAGFGETGPAGRDAERRLLEKVRAAGMRMVGPNCMGVINTDPAIRMHGTFAAVYPPAGNVAMSSQSGALGVAILDYARSLNIGFSTFLSVGNKADVSGNDLIQYWAEDPRTDVILLYLESFGNPRKFAEIARRVGKTKPIVLVKSGRSASGARAAASHTGALATSDAIVADLLRQAGVIRTDTLEEMFDVASLLANQPLPRGRRVAILTNAGGPGILAADACEARGLALPPLAESTVTRLRSFLPAAASVGNPVDMIASASPEHYKQSLEALLADPSIDNVLVIYIPVVPTQAPDVAAVIRETATRAAGKTILATFMSANGVPPSLEPVPAFPFPERAVGALARAAGYAEWRRRPEEEAKELNLDTIALRSIVDSALERGGGWLDPIEIEQLLRASGIETAGGEFVSDGEQAFQAAMRIGKPVALKAIGPKLLHKSDRGGVKLSLKNECEAQEAFLEMKSLLGDDMEAAFVQPMVTGGVEIMLGATNDPSFGHVLAFGAGGTLVEVLSDVAFRIHPLTPNDAEDMINELRCAKMLAGVRGAAPSDVPALREAIMRLSALISLCPEIQELDINPLKILEKGAIALDARVRVERLVPAAPTRRIAY
ncbi:MAG TPA: GNAT family N-acetyltransferase [Thermoanaerobaculia bacterium]|jgi:acetyl coenzyme A synthetase (ADP forming)-like protein|nr:GNAT family N-acetyltransferase [Thermoanaerobaculia bacterium]